MSLKTAWIVQCYIFTLLIILHVDLQSSHQYHEHFLLPLGMTSPLHGTMSSSSIGAIQLYQFEEQEELTISFKHQIGNFYFDSYVQQCCRLTNLFYYI